MLDVEQLTFFNNTFLSYECVSKYYYSEPFVVVYFPHIFVKKKQKKGAKKLKIMIKLLFDEALFFCIEEGELLATFWLKIC